MLAYTQVLATKRSMPSWGFGRATRDEVRKTVDGMFNKDFQYAAEYPRPSPGTCLYRGACAIANPAGAAC